MGNGRLNGSGCTNINECSDPLLCGTNGDCADLTPGFECDCDTGYTAVDDECVCDLNGTFAVRIALNMSWPAALDPILGTEVISAGQATTYSWALREHTYAPDGTLTVQTLPCGGTTPDLCGVDGDFTDAAAYSQYLRNDIWGLPGIPVTNEPAAQIPNALPGQPFATAMTASLLGIALPHLPTGWTPTDTTDFGWPNNRAAVTEMTRTDGPYWTLTDDAKYGITSYAVPPGGVSSTLSPVAYGATSAACSNLPYDYWPAVCGLSVCRVQSFYLGSRTISAFKGTFSSCNLITGNIIGPNPDGIDPGTDGDMRTDVRIYGCNRTTGADCSASTANTLDSQPQTQRIDAATFVMKRVPQGLIGANDGVTCSNIRTMMTYP